MVSPLYLDRFAWFHADLSFFLAGELSRVQGLFDTGCRLVAAAKAMAKSAKIVLATAQYLDARENLAFREQLFFFFD